MISGRKVCAEADDVEPASSSWASCVDLNVFFVVVYMTQYLIGYVGTEYLKQICSH